MPHRDFIQSEPLRDRIEIFAKNIRDRASLLPPGKEQDDLLRRARLADTALHLNDWVDSPGLRPPK